jgi:hypothetical protein
MKLILVSLFALALGSPAIADEGHNHEAAVEPAPHGGILRDAPPYKAELVLEGAIAKVFVYGKDLKPATLETKELTGKLRFPKEKKDKVVKFERKGEFFEAKIVGIDKVHRFDLHVTLQEGAQKVVIDFGIDNIH